MQPFYFGSSQKQLFGIYHAPESQPARASGVVLCHPLGHEYLRAHRAFRNLAVSLAGHGFHVLRFDYFGSGDSGGDPEDTTIAQCRADLDAAIDELKDTSGVTKVSLIGLRFGATLATFAAARRRDVERLVLWDPVLDGEAYIRELRALQHNWLVDRLGTADAAADETELIGFALTDATRAELEATSLSGSLPLRARSVALMLSEDRPSYRTLATALGEDGRSVACTVVAESSDWDRGDMVHQILLPHAMVRAIAAAMIS
jgi:uncharacterized protein